ncbi:hypothetical protein [Paracoccus saliphilus]|uniref:Sulfotransferase family protein n=1 Tax=Paracoccus saliphilus TaxID=405559 RepID=A0AA45W8R7_9RHOB|nr:hypothetical protein [Paracoccus saliphilus]WCR05498.1 hypothetical protein JHX88_21800 [Paracoccus saliphilus]SIT18300.1 hypothetical protein SAMN05421772_13511 [Paracoccus saliphilus]
MLKKLVFHIGSFKSGSTAIQSTLALKTYNCRGFDILYPGLGVHEGREKIRGQHGPLANTLFRQNPAYNKRDEHFSRIARNIETVDADVSIISAEKFEYADPRVLAEMINKHFGKFKDNLQIIIYLRPHAERVLAAFAERVKHGSFRGDMDDLHAQTKPLTGALQRGFYYYPRLNLWRDVFGDRLTVRPMVRSELRQADVVTDFFYQILDGAECSVTDVPSKNASPSLEDLVAVRAFHQACGKRKVTLRQEQAGIRLVQSFAEFPERNATRLALHMNLVADITATYAEDAQAIDSAFFDGTPMQDALRQAGEKAVPHPQSLDATQHLDHQQFRLLMVWARAMAELTA